MQQRFGLDRFPHSRGRALVKRLAAAAVLLLPALSAHAPPPHAGRQIGDVYEIRGVAEGSTEDSDGSTSSSSSRSAVIERVIAAREDGLELEYDFPGEVTAQQRTGTWQLPVRIFRPSRGPPQLLNWPELEARVDRWLRAANYPRAACGRWIFTWNAFRIECDPQSAITAVESFDLGPDDLRDGGLFEEAGAREAAPVRRTAAGPDGATFAVELAIDPEAVRLADVESDLVAAEIMGQGLTREAAVQAHASDQISGTMTITLETDAAGLVRRRVKETVLRVMGADGQAETRRATERLERRLVSRAEPART